MYGMYKFEQLDLYHPATSQHIIGKHILRGNGLLQSLTTIEILPITIKMYDLNTK